MDEKVHYPWKRYWRPAGGEVYCDPSEDGFLLDPGTRGLSFVNTDCKPLPEIFDQTPVLILCGPPGSGKSTELEAITQLHRPSNGVEVISLRADALGSGMLPALSVQSSKWLSALEDGKEILLLIDGLDEALQREQTLLSALIELLKGQPLERIKLILACRSVQWQPTTGAELVLLWGQQASPCGYELCPLRRGDVVLALDQELPGQTRDFIREMDRTESIPLARWPITLNMLIELFRRDGKLNASRRILYQHAITHLMEEWNEKLEDRTRKLDPEWLPGEKLQLARRIAALMIFGGKNALVRTNRRKTTDRLSYGEIQGGDGLNEIPHARTFEITQAKLDNLTESRLFEVIAPAEPNAPPTLRFCHRTFAEMLAGEYVTHLDLNQLRRLFFVRQSSGDECLVPQLMQTAAWLAGASDNSPFFELFLSLHPEAFLLADLTHLHAGKKAAIVRRLLEKSATGDPGPDLAVAAASHTLRFPGIEDLLQPTILDQNANLHARRFALSLTRTCRLTDLADAVWTIVDRSDDRMAEDAIKTLTFVEKNPKAQKDRLLRLAAGDGNSDGSDTIKGVALRMLVPECAPVREILSLLTPPKMENFFGGSYRRFLSYELLKAVTSEDLCPCLDFLRAEPACFDPLSVYEEFAHQVFDLACKNLDSLGVTDRLIQLWLEKSRNFHPLPGATRRNGKSLQLALHQNSSAFVRAFLNHPQVVRDDLAQLWHHLPEISLEFLLREIPAAPENRRTNWACAIRYAADTPERERYREPLQLRYSEYPELEPCFPPIRKPGLDLHDTLCRHERAGELKRERWRKRNKKRLQTISRKQLTWEDVFQKGVDQCCNGHTGGWINVASALEWDDNERRAEDINTEHSRLFIALSSGQQNTLRDCARRFLFEFNDDNHETGVRTSWSEVAYRAIKWLRSDINGNDRLMTVISDKWIGTIIDAFNNGEEQHQEMVQFACRLNPDKAREWLRKQLDRRASDPNEGWLLDLRAFQTAWNRDLSEELADFLSSPTLKPRSLWDGLGHLLEYDPEFGGTVLDNHLLAVRENDSALDSPQSRTVVGVALFRGSPSLQESVWPLIAGNPDSARKLFLQLVPELDRAEKNLLTDLSPALTANLLILFHQLFPPKNDPPFGREASFVSATDECIQFRGHLLRNLVKRGETNAIQHFLNTLPIEDTDHYRWNLVEARQNRALLDWIPAQPGELLRLVRIAHGSLIRDPDDLLEVVLGSLRRFQVDLQKHNLHRVWDGDTPKHEEFVSMELATWLTTDLKKIALNREVEVNRIKERVDLKLDALATDGSNAAPITLIIEVKRAHNVEVRESVGNQLVDKYLDSKFNWNHGLYLVAWFYSKGKWDGRRHLRSKTPKGAANELKKLCEAVESARGVRIEPFLLDCSYPSRGKKRRPADS